MSSFAPWLADYQLLAVALLLGVMLAIAALRQPAQRLAVAKSTLAALAALAILCALPGWSLVHLLSEPPAASDTTASSIAEPSPITQTTTPFTPPLDAEASSTAIPIPPFAAPSQPTPLSADPIDWISATVMAYAAGSVAVAFWLITGALLAHRVRREATPAPPELQQLLQELCGPEKQTPQLLISPRITAPVALGLRRPTILLPPSAIPLPPSQLLPILAHELAHIEHRDLHTLAATRLLFILLWPQPLFWLLRRTIRLDQETLADAAAADRAGRLDYAQQLLAWARTAGTQRPPRLAGAVGLWEGPSQLKRRIAVLLNEKFNVMRNASRAWRWSCIIAISASALGLSMVTLQPSAKAAEEGVDKAKANAQEATPETRHRSIGQAGVFSFVADPPKPPTYKPNAFALRAIDADAKPLSGVEVLLYRTSLSDGVQQEIAAATTNEAGEVEFSDLVPADQLEEDKQREAKNIIGNSHRPFFHAALKRPGFATAIVSKSSIDVGQRGAKRTVMMRPAATLSGRVTDPQGNPVANATVAAGGMASWFAVPGVNAVTTNDDGEYHFDDRVAFVRAKQERPGSSPNDATALQVHSLEMESDEVPLDPAKDQEAASLIVTHPNFAMTRAVGEQIPGELNVQLSPAAAIRGRVVDYQSGAPVAGIPIHAWGMPPLDPNKPVDPRSAAGHSAHTTTNEAGAYELKNLPAGRYDIWAEPQTAPDEPRSWISRGVSAISAIPGNAPATAPDLVVGPPPKLRVQLVNAETGAPIQLKAGAHAQPIENLVGGPQFQNVSPHRVDVTTDGVFEMEATPGKNRLGVFVYDGEQKHPPAFQTGDSVYAAGEVLDLRLGEMQNAQLKVYPYQSLLTLRELEQRGHKLMAEKKYAEAIEAFSDILRNHPAYRDALIGRGYAYRSAGDFSRSIADFEAALTASGEDQQAEYVLADLLATSPVEGTRDGERALRFAQRALAHARQGYQYDTSSLVTALEIIASAHAETGDFTNAVAAEREAIELAPESRKADMQKRLKLYQSNKPFRREAASSDTKTSAEKPADQGASTSPALFPLTTKAVELPPPSPTMVRAVATPNPAAGLTQLDALDLKFPSDATWHLVPQTKINLNAAATLGGAVK